MTLLHTKAAIGGTFVCSAVAKKKKSHIYFGGLLIFRLEITTMSGKFDLPIGYNQEMECRVLEMPFSQKRISMFILLPDDPLHGLTRLEANMTTSNIKMLFSTLKVSFALAFKPGID